MVAAVGNRVQTLHRSAFGALELDAAPGARPVALAARAGVGLAVVIIARCRSFAGCRALPMPSRAAR
jgi:hypothetical protein